MARGTSNLLLLLGLLMMYLVVVSSNPQRDPCTVPSVQNGRLMDSTLAGTRVAHGAYVEVDCPLLPRSYGYQRNYEPIQCRDGTLDLRCDDVPCDEDRDFHCEDGSKCVHHDWVCDQRSDCPDSSDERVCAPCSVPSEIKRALQSDTTLSGTDVTHGTRVVMDCKETFQLVRPGPSVCYNGKWRHYHRCEPVAPCIVREIENGRTTTLAGTSVPHGDTFRVECEDNYRIAGNNYPRCNNGTWDSYPRCREIDESGGGSIHGVHAVAAIFLDPCNVRDNVGGVNFDVDCDADDGDLPWYDDEV